MSRSSSEESLREIKYFKLREAPNTKLSHLEISRTDDALNIFRQNPSVKANDIQNLMKRNPTQLETYELHHNKSIMVLNITQKLMVDDDFYKPIFIKNKKVLKNMNMRPQSPKKGVMKKIEIERMKHVANKISSDDVGAKVRKISNVSVMHLLSPESPTTPPNAKKNIDKFSYTNKDSYNSQVSHGKETAFFN